MKAPFSLPGKIFGGLVVIAAHWLALTPNLTAQGIDPGPRPTGSNPAPLSVCQVVNGVTKKFNTSTCFDVDQPRTNTPPAEGAGQIIAGAGNLDIFWFQALTVFANTANVTPLTPPATSITGLGPSFNALSCFGCHAQPTIGGASPGLVNVNGNIEGTPQPGGGQFANVTQNPSSSPLSPMEQPIGCPVSSSHRVSRAMPAISLWVIFQKKTSAMDRWRRFAFLWDSTPRLPPT